MWEMRYAPINPELFKLNRERLRNLMLKNSLAVVNANDVMPSNADGTLGFRQNSDLFYLTGVDQEETILLLFPNASDEKMREVLFVRETNALIATWEGHKLTKEEARRLTGIQNVRWVTEFPRIFQGLMWEGESVYRNTREEGGGGGRGESRAGVFIAECQQKSPLHRRERLARLMHHLRLTKSIGRAHV